MDRIERVYKIVKLLRDHRVVSVQDFTDHLEMSKATFKRDLEYLRDRFKAPIVWDREVNGYRMHEGRDRDKFELPGLWFSASEIHALLTMRQLLASLGPGLLTEQLDPLLSRMRLLLDGEHVPMESFQQRVRIQRPSARHFEPEHFLPLATAVMQRKRLYISHHNRFRNETILREISPQRLTHYRENWYVDAWCHLRDELRSFGLSAIRETHIIDTVAREVPDAEISAALDSGYGIFSGTELEWAELVFTPERAQWVCQEIWHPDQQSSTDEQGNYHLRFPYNDPREVAADILRHIPHVRVVGPPSMRARVIDLLSEAMSRI